MCSTKLSVPCRTITSVLLRPLSRFRENSFRKGERERDRLLSLASGNNQSFIFATGIWLHTNHTPFHSTKPVIQANKKPCIYWNTWSTSTLPSDEENNHFTFATQKIIKLQGYAIYVDTLLIETVYAFFVATNLKITHSLEPKGIILQTKEQKPPITEMGNKKGLGIPGNWNIYVIFKWKIIWCSWKQKYMTLQYMYQVLKILLSILQKSA